jgi:hypothetical protein
VYPAGAEVQRLYLSRVWQGCVSELSGREDPFAFHALVRAPRREVPELLDAAARPGDDRMIDAIPPADAEGDGKLRLREVAGSALDDPRLRRRPVQDADLRANGVPIGRRPDEAEPEAPIP